MRPDLDPDLPVGIETAEGKMFAFDTVDNAAADMLGVEHLRHHLVV